MPQRAEYIEYTPAEETKSKNSTNPLLVHGRSWPMPPSSADLRLAFQLFDTDGTGTLSQSELAVILQRGEGDNVFSADQAMLGAQQILEDFDTNNDGKLQFEEFLIWWKDKMEDGKDDKLLTPIVIDFGTSTIKAGIAGEASPRVVITNLVGTPKEGRFYVGRELQRRLQSGELLTLTRPIENGIVTDWDKWEELMKELFTELDITDGHPVLVTELPFNPLQNRERMAQILFETFKREALLLTHQEPLALLHCFYSGLCSSLTGVVLMVGAGCIFAVPMCDKGVIMSAVQRQNYGGLDLDDYMTALLREQGYTLSSSQANIEPS